MTVAIASDAAQSGYLKVHIEGDATVAGLLGQIPNPEGVQLFVPEAWLHFTTPSTAAATQNMGFAASGVDATDLLSAFAMNQVAGTVWTVVGRAAAEAAATPQNGALWGATEFLTITNAAAASTDLVADLYIRYIRLA